MGKLICPNCKSKSIRKNLYASDNIFGLSRNRWFEETGRWVCENCGTFIKDNKERRTRLKNSKKQDSLWGKPI